MRFPHVGNDEVYVLIIHVRYGKWERHLRSVQTVPASVPYGRHSSLLWRGAPCPCPGGSGGRSGGRPMGSARGMPGVSRGADNKQEYF